MRHGRHLAVAALAGPMALVLVAASAPETGPHGTASTSLSAVELAITTPVGDGALDLVGLSTFASTTADTAVNPKGAPFASALLTPLTGPTGEVGTTEARSDGDTSARSGEATLSGIGGPLAELGATVSPTTMTANAAAGEARAAVDTLTARIAGLAGALGVEVDTTEISSAVDAAGASAVQGLTVSGLEVTLGDIIPQDVLATLPLPDLLALLETLPVELPGDAQQLIDELRRVVEELATQLRTVEVTGADAEETLADLATTVEAYEALLELDELRSQIEALPEDSTSEDLQPIADAVGETTGEVTGVIGDLLGSSAELLTTQSVTTFATTACDDLSSTEVTTAQLTDCIDGLLIDLTNALGVEEIEAVASVERLITELVEELTVLVDTLVEQIEGLVPVLGTLTSATAALDDLLAALDGLLADAAGTPLVGVSSFDVGFHAISDGTLDGSSATLLCAPVTVTILSETVSTPSCDQGLTAVTDATAVVDGMLASLTDTLNVLPLAEVLTTGDLRVELFSNVQRSVERQGDAVVATAGMDILDLDVPALTIDPGAVTGLLDGLGLPDVLGTVETLLGDLLAEAEALGLPELATVTSTLTTAVGEVGAAGGIEDLTDQLNALIEGLDLSQLGTLDRITTPSVSLRVDPVSTASFTAAAPSTPVAAPAPEPTPSLPNTGGGLALLGALSLAGAYSLRRRW